LLGTIRRLRDPVEQEHYIKKIAEITETSLEAMNAKLNTKPAQQEVRQKKVKAPQKSLFRSSKTIFWQWL
jgi:DNA primase